MQSGRTGKSATTIVHTRENVRPVLGLVSVAEMFNEYVPGADAVKKSRFPVKLAVAVGLTLTTDHDAEVPDVTKLYVALYWTFVPAELLVGQLNEGNALTVIGHEMAGDLAPYASVTRMLEMVTEGVDTVTVPVELIIPVVACMTYGEEAPEVMLKLGVETLTTKELEYV